MNGADVAWMLAATALVLLMTPALAFFYGGLVRTKNALNTMMMSLSALGVVGLGWAMLGYSLAFAPGGSWIGGFSHAFLSGVGLEPKGTIPHVLFFAYQGTFAIITAALISGAVVERMRFTAYLAFLALWGILVYAPVAHWVWGGGWLSRMGALDFAGGTVVHVNAAAAALVAATVVRPRKDHARQAMLPHNVPFTLLGAGLLWFGWFGFNGGSALAANASAALAFTNTMLAPIATLVVWTLLDLRRAGRATAVGAATAIVVGLVAITPAAGLVSPLASLTIGAVAAAPSYFALLWRARTRLDDSLDVVAAHGIGGTVGALLTGVFAQKSWNGAADGLLFGNPKQVAFQAAGILATVAWSAAATYGILKLVGLFIPLRAESRDEGLGLDVTQHGEEAYTRGEGAILVLRDAVTPVPPRSRSPVASSRSGSRPFEARRRRREAGEALGSPRVPLPCRGARSHSSPRRRSRRGDGAGRDLPGNDGQDGALRESASRDRRLGPLRRADRRRDPAGGTDWRGRRRKDLRPPGREGVPDPDGGGRPGRGHPRRGLSPDRGPLPRPDGGSLSRAVSVDCSGEETRNVTKTEPVLISSPSESRTGLRTRRAPTKVPFLLPKSSTCSPSSVTTIRAWWRETVVSSIRARAAGSRPMMFSPRARGISCLFQRSQHLLFAGE